jgi:hypothetical protein
MGLSIHSLYQQIFKIWRRRRFQLFLRVLQPKPTDRLLDVGGDPNFWTPYLQPVREIDSLNLSAGTWSPEQAPNHRINVIVGDGCALPMADKTYDIGFSNSVIEHVSTWENQQKFAAEIRRVSKALWVQTPAYGCPIEPHYLAPFVHYLPKGAQRRVIRNFTPRGWLERPSREQVKWMVETTRLLKKTEMKELFPDCEILTERMLGILPKSYIAVRRG